jgi:hypothetical protein
MGYPPTVLIALLGWPVLMACLVVVLPVRRVVLVSIIGGNLFLPQAGLFFAGLPDYTKPNAAGLGALVAALLVATPQLLSWRPKAIDLFFFAFLISSSVSSLFNGLGPYDAMSNLVNRFLEWGVAYWVGRAMFRGDGAMRELALGFVLGGVVYAPLCIWESVMSPQLHVQLYGFRPSSFVMAKRWGGWRPMVFMQHGLAVANWMAASAAVAWVLWRSKAVPRLWMIPMGFVAAGLVVVTLLLRSTGAAVLLLGMIAAVEFVQISRARLALFALILAPAAYIGLRVAGWEGQQLLDLAGMLDEGRVSSLRVRLENDTRIVSRAMEQPFFGWGGWGRWRVRDEFGQDITISDSWWGIVVGSTGLFGLISAYGAFMAPMFLLIRQRTRRRIFEGSRGAAWAVGMAILLFILDTLVNAMPNTSFMLAAGAMASFVLSQRQGREPGAEEGSGGRATVSAVVPGRQRPIDLR